MCNFFETLRGIVADNKAQLIVLLYIAAVLTVALIVDITQG